MESARIVLLLLFLIQLCYSITPYDSFPTTEPWQYQISNTPLGTITYTFTNKISKCQQVCTRGQFCTVTASDRVICRAYCGDGIVAVGQSQPGKCDDGNTNPYDGCNKCQVSPGYFCGNQNQVPGAKSVCTRHCGDGQLDTQFLQECDDHNQNNGDGCTSKCRIISTWTCQTTPAIKGTSICKPLCGDGRRVGNQLQPQRCDDQNTQSGDGCSSDCFIQQHYVCRGSPSTCTPSCNNGIINKYAQQVCDNGDNFDQDFMPAVDGCNQICEKQVGWQCYSPVNNRVSVCSPICGDGAVNGKQKCDDSNWINGDGCDDKCQVQLGWTCLDDNGVYVGCTPLCGDGIRVGDQLLSRGCDDSNPDPGDGCFQCKVQPLYACYPDTNNVEKCKNVCGNAKLNSLAGEVCDNGETIDADTGNRVVDGCSQDCQVQATWTCSSGPDYQTSICTQ